MKNMIKDAGVLFFITLTAGLLLGFIYQITKEPIAVAEEKAAQAAYREVFEQAQQFGELDKEQYESLISGAGWENQGFAGVSLENILEATDANGGLLGYILVVTSHEGYGGDITLAAGITNDGTLNGIAILSISETPGLGMKADEVLKPQYENKQVNSFTYTKTGAVMEDQIDAISGATITTSAVTNAVNASLYCFQSIMQEGLVNE